VELGLKARICRTLGWQGYPSTSSEFKDYQSFRTHNLEVLLRLTGREQHIKKNFLAEWSAVAQWNPEARYQSIGRNSESDARLIFAAATTLLSEL
jgi:hypothetical protein